MEIPGTCVFCESRHIACTFNDPPSLRRHKINQGPSISSTLLQPQQQEQPLQSQTRTQSQAAYVPSYRIVSDSAVASAARTTSSVASSDSSIVLSDQGELPSTSQRSDSEDAANSKDSTDELEPVQLDLQPGYHISYIGLTGEQEAYLIRQYPLDGNDEYTFVRLCLRSIQWDERFPVQFMKIPDDIAEPQNDNSVDRHMLEQIVHPFGQNLIDLYFHVVHPSFPIIYKSQFLKAYKENRSTISLALLAAIYSVASNWWTYRHHLSVQKKPDIKSIDKIAVRLMEKEFHRPTLMTIQAGLLLLQRRPLHSNFADDMWHRTSTTNVVTLAQGLGLHIEPKDWRVPQWEKSIRKIVWWGVYIQDKYSAMAFSNAPHMHERDTNHTNLEFQDLEVLFDESDAKDPDHVRGTYQFVALTQLCIILHEVLVSFYSVQGVLELQNDTTRCIEKVAPYKHRLLTWFRELPDEIKLEDCSRGKLNPTGSLFLAYHTAQITLHRSIVRSICNSSAEKKESVSAVLRSEIVMPFLDFIKELRPEHLQAFWHYSSRVNFAIAGSFLALLYVTSPTEQAASLHKEYIEEYRWHLRLHSTSLDLMALALVRIDSYFWAGYENLFHLKLSPSPVNSVTTSEENGVYSTEDGRRRSSTASGAQMHSRDNLSNLLSYAMHNNEFSEMARNGEFPAWELMGGGVDAWNTMLNYYDQILQDDLLRSHTNN